MTEVTHCRRKSKYGGLNGAQVKRLKQLEAKNTRLRRAILNLTLEKLILKVACREPKVRFNETSSKFGEHWSTRFLRRRDCKKYRYPLRSLFSQRSTPSRLMIGLEGLSVVRTFGADRGVD